MNDNTKNSNRIFYSEKPKQVNGKHNGFAKTTAEKFSTVAESEFSSGNSRGSPCGREIPYNEMPVYPAK
jgi:hypothetical protein